MWRYFQEVNFSFDQLNLIITYLPSLFVLFDKCSPYSIFLKCYLFFAPNDGPIKSETIPIHAFKEMISQEQKLYIYNTYDFLRLQNKTRTLRKITNTTAHPTAMPITALFVLVSLVPLLVADSVSEVVCLKP